MTPFLSPNFPLMYLKRCTHDFNLQLLLTIQLLTYETMFKNIVLTDAMDCKTWSFYATFDLQGRLRVQTVTYEDVSVCNLSPNFSCFISTTTFPHKCIAYETRSCACSHTTRRVSAHFLTYEDMSMRNI